MFTRRFLLAAAAVIAGCGSADTGLNLWGQSGKGEATTPIEVEAEGIAEWKLYSVNERVAVGPDSREALVRVSVPRAEAQPVVAPPVVRLKVQLDRSDRLSNDEHFRGLLYHDYYLSGPKAGTHKYQIPLVASKARTSYVGGGGESKTVVLEWRVPEVVGDPSNARTWAVSFASFSPKSSDRAILGVEIWFRKSASRDDSHRFHANYWPGEGVYGYRMLDDVLVKGRAEANAQAPQKLCSIEAGHRFHPWEGSPVIYRTTIERYRALVPVQFQACMPGADADTDDPDCRPFEVPAGGIVEQLVQHGEGLCDLRWDGMTFDWECLDWSGVDTFIRIPTATVQPDEMYFKAPCLEGGTAWINTDDIEVFTTGEDAPVATYRPFFDWAKVITESDFEEASQSGVIPSFDVELGQDVEVRLSADEPAGYRWFVKSTNRTFGHPSIEYMPFADKEGGAGTTVLIWKTDQENLSLAGEHKVVLEYRDRSGVAVKTLTFVVAIAAG